MAAVPLTVRTSRHLLEGGVIRHEVSGQDYSIIGEDGPATALIPEQMNNILVRGIPDAWSLLFKHSLCGRKIIKGDDGKANDPSGWLTNERQKSGYASKERSYYGMGI